MMTTRLFAQSARAATRPTSLVSRTAIRTYATPTETKPPVALFGIDGTYASALYTAAAKTSTLDPTASALSRLEASFQRDPKLSTIINAPTLSHSDKSALITELVKSSGASGEGANTVKNLLSTLSDNNRMGVLPGICEKFAQLMSASKGEIEMVVTSAAPLDAKVVQRLESAVGKSEYVGQGKKLKVVTRVQPDIRGGLVVEIGDRTIDLSVSAKMARMNKLLQDTL